MSILSLFFLALSLAADAFAVALGIWMSRQKILMRQALMMAWCFGIFQAIMPILGYSLASLFSEIIRDYDHWIAFILLGYIWGNMIYSGLKKEEESLEKDVFSLRSLLTLGIATSIDALAVWVSLTATEESIYFPALVIGIITFVASFIALESGKRLSDKLGSYAEVCGGAILIGIGINILIEHTF